MIQVPHQFFTVRYSAKHFPGTERSAGILKEANCQLFAYELLRYFGKYIPDFRSSNLWEDNIWTQRVDTFEPLDLVLYNAVDTVWVPMLPFILVTISSFTSAKTLALQPFGHTITF